MEKIRIGIVGYGNLGRGVEKAIEYNPDMDLVGIFTRRNPGSLDTQSPAYSLDDLLSFKDKIDVCVLCGGSATDLVDQGPEIAKHFNTVDSYDNHGNIPNYYASLDKVSRDSGTTALMSIGWDPGLFSINRLIGESVLPSGRTETFWGPGVSQGHSDALRRIKGIEKAIQYTIPKEEVVQSIKNGEDLNIKPEEKHKRLCYIVLEDGANEGEIREEILNMPGYFKGYDVEINVINKKEFNERQEGMPHGGRVIRIGETSQATKQVYEFSLELESNPEFTASVLLTFARASYRMYKEGQVGAKTIMDVPLKYLSSKSEEELRKTLL